MKKITYIIFPLLFSLASPAQVEKTDPAITLDSIIIRSFEQHKPPAKTAIQISTLTPAVFEFSSRTSLVNGMNAVAGVRMEERSPGSYRISIRGSSLRSPFGVRNIKVYWNGFPVTDPGGNTYFNQFATNNFSNIEIVKGPVSSMYGAGTGGLVLLENAARLNTTTASMEYNGGSFGLSNLFLTAKSGNSKTQHIISYAHNSAGGYRDQSRLRRDNFSWLSTTTHDKHVLKAALLFTDMYYQTPGGLTLAEFLQNPSAARPAANGFPAAATAGAAIFQKNLLTGISNRFDLSTRLSNTTLFYGAYAGIKNPAIRNYEKRTEPSFGGRTVFTYRRFTSGYQLFLDAGAEVQQGYFSTRVSRNKNGNPDSLLTDDEIRNTAIVYFLQTHITAGEHWYLSAGSAISTTKLAFTRLNNYPVTEQARRYRNEFTPQIAVKRDLGKNFQWSVSASRGFSPPTVAEVLPSTGVISTYLEAEKGWNFQSSVSYTTRTSAVPRIRVELTGFYFRLRDALVQRRDLSGADYFVNAGDVLQKGLELHTSLVHRFYGQMVQEISFRGDFSVNHFRYGSFIRGNDDYSGKTVPSVPASSVSLLGEISSRAGLYLKVSYYGNAPVYLNDANTAKAPPYHLLGTQLGWKKKTKGPFSLNLYAGADNLLNEQYSPGSDINAAGGRYFNAAASRNFYAGLFVQWTKIRK